MVENRYRFNLVGITYDNDDGTSRQRILELSAGEKTAHLLRDTENEYDSNAFAIATSFGLIGYLPAGIAAEIAPAVDAGNDRFVIPYLVIEQFQTNEETWLWGADVIIETRSLNTGQTEYLQNWSPTEQTENIKTGSQNAQAVLTIATMIIAVIVSLILFW